MSIDTLLNISDFSKGLLPVAVQDLNTKDVLMLAFVDRKAVQLSIETGYATYFQRSTQSYWKKGETSGNLQRLIEIRYNCYGNSLLYLVEQQGEGACHDKDETCKPHWSCFYRTLWSSEEPSS